MPGGQEGLSGPQGLQHPHPSSDPLCCHWGGGPPPLLGGFSGTQTQHRGTPKGLKVVQMSACFRTCHSRKVPVCLGWEAGSPAPG